jgi:hypothetical protein
MKKSASSHSGCIALSIAMIGAAGAIIAALIAVLPSMMARHTHEPDSSSLRALGSQASNAAQTTTGNTKHDTKAIDSIASGNAGFGKQQPAHEEKGNTPASDHNLKHLQDGESQKPITLQITSKLGVKTKVEVWQLAYTTNAIGRVPHHFRNQAIALNQGSGVYLLAPVDRVKKALTTEKGTILTLFDGSEHRGTLATNAVDAKNMSHDLCTAAEVENLSPPPAPKGADLGRLKFNLQISSLSGDKNDVYAPKFGPNRTSGFYFKLNKETMFPDASDFERVAFSKLKDQWQVTVKAPSAPERIGQWDFGGGIETWVVFETTAGCFVALQCLAGRVGGEDGVAGFSFDRIVTGKGKK